MKILIRPSEFILRCIWDKYEKYVLEIKYDNKVDIAKLLADDLEFEITEDDAYCAGLLKCVETPNFIHRCNQYIEDELKLKNIEIERKPEKEVIEQTEDDGDDEEGGASTKKKYFYMIKKKTYLEVLKKFMSKFPNEWNPPLEYKKSLTDVVEYVKYLINITEDLKIYHHTDKHGVQEMLFCNHITKTLKKYTK